MELTAQDIKDYVTLQSAIGTAQEKGNTIRFLSEDDLDEKSDTQDRWLARLSTRHRKHKGERSEIAKLMVKISNLELMTTKDFENLRKYIA